MNNNHNTVKIFHVITSLIENICKKLAGIFNYFTFSDFYIEF